MTDAATPPRRGDAVEPAHGPPRAAARDEDALDTDAPIERQQEPEPTLRDIAARAGVSVAAVSKVLNNREGVGAETRERISRLAREMGYRGRGGRASGLQTAALVTLDRYVMNDAFYGPIIAGIVDSAAEQGLEVRVDVAAAAGGDASLLRLLASSGVEPVFLVGIDGASVVDALVDAGRPAVIVNGMDRSMRLPSVSPDYHFGAWKATRHLIDLGHRDILHVTHPYRETIRRRIDGFRNALDEAGIGFDPARHVFDLGAPERMSMAAGEQVLAAIDARGALPDAIFCVNDIVALGVMRALQSRGLAVPEDVSVMGFDGLPVGAYAAPALASMRIDRAALGRIALALLAEQGEHSGRAVPRTTIGVELLERQSTAPRRA